MTPHPGWTGPAGEDPYANTPRQDRRSPEQVIRLDLDSISVVSTSLAQVEAPWERRILNYVHYSVMTETPGEHDIAWMVWADETCEVEVRAVLKAPQGAITVSCGEETLRCGLLDNEPDRTCLGVLSLRAGRNHIRAGVTVRTSAEVCSLELVKPEVARRVNAEAGRRRHQPAWFRDAGYGLMFQWTNRATPERGEAMNSWERKVAEFDIDRFADLVEDLGAGYVLWSVTWGQQYISAPIRTLDALLPGRTTERDLLGELADRLAARSIRLLFYYHFGYDCYHSVDRAWMEAVGGYRADKTQLFENCRAVIAEIAQRYGSRLHGWYFDGSRRYYDAHWDSTPAGGPLSAPFPELAEAARRGNPNRLITWNSWIWPPETPFADYAPCEWYREYDGVVDGLITRGPFRGVLAHSAFPLEEHWGHIEPDKPIGAPTRDAPQLAAMVRKARANRYPLSINLEMYENGTVSPQSAGVLEEMRRLLENGESR